MQCRTLILFRDGAGAPYERSLGAWLGMTSLAPTSSWLPGG
jgi:hypothetical protein